MNLASLEWVSANIYVACLGHFIESVALLFS